jgi:hypothetical protein
VIPSSGLELVVVLAALGPGYVYLRVAERRMVRPERSGLLEAVELVVIGALASTVALLLVLILADWSSVVNMHDLGREGDVYLKHHPLRMLWVVAVVLLIAYVLVWVAARIALRGQQPTIEPGGTSWQASFSENKPTKDHAVALSVELKDHRVIQGVLGGYTTNADDNRELCLVAPIFVRGGVEAQPHERTDAFIVVREADVLAVSGRYLEGARATS